MLIIVRHGRTEANARGLLLGRLDPDLDELGRRQAAAVAAAIGPVDRVIASPLARTRQTAAAFSVTGEVEIDERWIELDYGEFDGRPMREVPAAVWAEWRSNLDFTPPGGESIAELGSRVRQAADDLFADAAARTVVVVTHVSPVKAALAWALGVGDEVAWRSFVTPASVMRIGCSGPVPSLQSFNEVTTVEPDDLS